jgi:hypothetical protein
VAPLEKIEECLERPGQPSHLIAAADEPVRPEHVVGILRPVDGDLALEDDAKRLVDGKVGAFDIVLKVGFKESRVIEGRRLGRAVGAPGPGRTAQGSKQPLEDSEAVRVIRLPRCIGARGRCRKVGPARTEKRSDKGIEYPELLLKS